MKKLSKKFYSIMFYIEFFKKIKRALLRKV